MKTLTFSFLLIVSLFCCVTSVNSAVISAYFEDTGPQQQVAFDLSSYLGAIDNSTDFSLKFTINYVSQYSLSNQNAYPVTYGSQTLTSSILFGLEAIEMGGSFLLFPGNTSQESVQYNISGGQINSGTIDQFVGDPVNNTVVINVTKSGLATYNLLSLLDSSNWLTINFGILMDDLTTIPIPGLTGNAGLVSASGTVELDFDAPQAGTPEPASMLIFGVATVVGLPLVRRFRRKK